MIKNANPNQKRSMSVKSILDDIASTSSRNEKEAFLLGEKENQELYAVIKATYDPFSQYYVRGVVEVEENSLDPLEPMELIEAVGHLALLKERVYTGHKARDYVARINEALSEDDRDTFAKIISRDLKVGSSVKTFNKIWPNMIPEYPCMLASSYSEKAIEEITFPALSQTKMDGMRCNIIVHSDGNVEVRSRAGRLFETHGVFDEEAMRIRDFIDQHNEGWYVVLDGELLCHDSNMNILPRQISNGICNKANKGTITELEAQKLTLVVWDYIPEPVFEGDVEDPLMYIERYDMLYNLFCEEALSRFMLVETTEVANLAEARKHYKEMLDDGQEGTILKDKTVGWSNTRSKLTVKFKEIKDIDLRVVGWNEGTGKNKGLLGALICETDDGLIQTKVGTGFSDEQRKLYTKDFVIGKIVELEYNMRIESKREDKVDSLFLPRFIELREDKDTTNSSVGV